MKNIKYGENKHNISVFLHTKIPSVTIQGNITAMRSRNDVIRSVLLHIRANLGMMLARDYASCPAARSTLVMFVANNVQTRRCRTYDRMYDCIKCILCFVFISGNNDAKYRKQT